MRLSRYLRGLSVETRRSQGPHVSNETGSGRSSMMERYSNPGPGAFRGIAATLTDHRICGLADVEDVAAALLHGGGGPSSELAKPEGLTVLEVSWLSGCVSSTGGMSYWTSARLTRQTLTAYRLGALQ